MPKISLRKPLTVVISVEGLATSALGCYGCSWNSTPAIDTLAAGGTVWDRWTSPIDQPNGLIQKWLSGMEDMKDSGRQSGRQVFLTDSKSVDLSAAENVFESVTRIETKSCSQPRENPDQTNLAHVFAGLMDQVSPQTSLGWLHVESLCKLWDAPLDPDPELDEITEPIEGDEEDPADIVEPFRLADDTTVPSIERQSSDDPDLMFAWMQRYAAQVRLLDEMIGILLEAVRRRSPTVLLVGSSGFSLGQNGWIGHRVGPLRSNDIRLPLIIAGDASLRVPSLISAEQLPRLLSKIASAERLVPPTQWCQQDEECEPTIVTDSDRCVRAATSSKWFYVQDQPNDEERLYLKPDDIEDVNNVARLRHDITERLSANVE